MVRVTPAGRTLFERGRAARVRFLAERLAVLTDADRRTVERAARIMAGLL
jgi:DNA-binding MarR family transcriptional regulator